AIAHRCMWVGSLLESSTDLFPAAMEQPGLGSTTSIGQSDSAGLVCRSGGARFSARVLGLLDLFSSVWRTALHGRVLLERPGDLEEAPPCSGCAQRAVGQAGIVGALRGPQGRLVLPLLRRQ